MIERYTPEKWIWTEADFENISLHDCQIHAYAMVNEAFTREFLLDIDYILQWVCPTSIAEDRSIWFWVAPATLVFEEVDSINLEIEARGSFLAVEINKFEREAGNGQIKWILDCFGAGIEITAPHFKLYIRSEPHFLQAQSLDLGSRGGISFGRNTPASES